MLRITCENGNGLHRTLKVEGRIVGPEIDELSRSVLLALADSPRVVLEMAGVTYIDRAGVELIQTLCGNGAELGECPSFIRTLVNGGGK